MSGIIRPMTADKSTRLSSSMIFEFQNSDVSTRSSCWSWEESCMWLVCDVMMRSLETRIEKSYSYQISYSYSQSRPTLKERRHAMLVLKRLSLKFSSSSLICNPCQSSLSFTIFLRLLFIIIFLVFFYHSKLLFQGFLQLIR